MWTKYEALPSLFSKDMIITHTFKKLHMFFLSVCPDVFGPNQAYNATRSNCGYVHNCEVSERCMLWRYMCIHIL